MDKKSPPFPVGKFGNALNLFAEGVQPKGIETVATTMEPPGPIVDPGCPIHGYGCPSHCPVLKAAQEFERNPPPKCRRG